MYTSVGVVVLYPLRVADVPGVGCQVEWRAEGTLSSGRCTARLLRLELCTARGDANAVAH